MMLHNLTLKGETLLLDDKEIKGVTKFKITSSADGLAELVIEMVVNIKEVVSEHMT